MNERLAGLVKELAIARENQEANRRLALEMVEAVEASDVFKEHFEASKTWSDEVERLTKELKEVGLAAFIYDPTEKQLHPAVQVKEYETVAIPDADALLDYAIQHGHSLLKLDAKKVEAVAKAGGIPNKLAPVTIEPRVTISTDLSEYI